MPIVHYTRSQGQRLTYEIRTDPRGRYAVLLDGKLLMRGHDALSADGRHRSANKRKEAGALEQAKLAIERLASMDET